jgi:hypothetical protein
MVLIEMLEDLPLRGAMPFERAREDELIYVLRRLLDLEVWEDGLKAVAQGESEFAGALSVHVLIYISVQGNAGSSALKQALLASPRAHLLHLYPILLDIATYNGPGLLPKVWVAKRAVPTGDYSQWSAGKGDKKEEKQDEKQEAGEDSDNNSEASDDAVEVDAKEVAKACLKALSKDVGF